MTSSWVAVTRQPYSRVSRWPTTIGGGGRGCHREWGAGWGWGSGGGKAICPNRLSITVVTNRGELFSDLQHNNLLPLAKWNEEEMKILFNLVTKTLLSYHRERQRGGTATFSKQTRKLRKGKTVDERKENASTKTNILCFMVYSLYFLVV